MIKTKRRVVFMTGATGVMGYETLKEFSRHGEEFEVRILARRSKKNEKKLAPYKDGSNINVIWGDMMNPEDVEHGMGDAEYVLHIGGVVSPLADHVPQKAMKVNIGSARILVDTIKKRPNRDEIKLVYIGSVAEMSHRYPPHHWGRAGDPIIAGVYDYYGISKIEAERVVAESGLKHWVSLRQSGILHKGLVDRATDPISFHVPLRGVLEWATVEDSARLMVGVCREGVPVSFWRNFYFIGSGKEFRLTNYEFEKLLLESMGCPPPEKSFKTRWFATRNFHGLWFSDSDRLNEIIPFREEITAEAYFKRMVGKMPWWVKLSPLAPGWLIRGFMWWVAHTKDMGPLNWLSREDCEQKIRAYYGSRDAIKEIPDWEGMDLSRPSERPEQLNHGYDESKPEEELGIEDMRQAAAYRGGKCLSAEMEPGDLDTPLEWECSYGHRFRATPRIVLKGGHWCPQCMPAPWKYDDEAKRNPFMAQVWYDSHAADEDEIYV